MKQQLAKFARLVSRAYFARLFPRQEQTMSPDFNFRGQPRHWYVAPFSIGILLILFGILIIAYPWLLAVMIALPLIFIGIAFLIIGLDLWRGVHQWQGWREYCRFGKWRGGPPTE